MEKPKMNNEPTVYVVDDDAAVRNSLRFLIESAGFRVTTFANAREFLSGYDSDVPGCLVLDVRLPGSSGLDLQQQLVAEGIGVPVIIVTGHGDVPIAVRAMRTGALDFIEKPYDDQVLLDRIRHAVELDIRNRRDRAERQDILSRVALLTPREREVLEGVVSGSANKQIAGDLGISTKTVEAHRAHVMEKMRVESLAELVRLVQIAGVARNPVPVAAGAR
jgi:FixJ family two-component response regulator